MRDVKYIKFLFLLLVGFCFSSCDKDEKVIEKDGRINNVISPTIRQQMSPYITIYDGNTPPNLEGEYLVSPMETVYDSEEYYEVGKIIADCYLKFSNQNMQKNTLDYQERQVDSNGNTLADAVGYGAFISGEGNNFSIYYPIRG